MRRNRASKTWTTEKAVGAQFAVEAGDSWVCERLAKPRVIVLDNAPIHRSLLVQSRLAEWGAKNLYVFYLPPYSMHLNLIEILWRKMTYEWLKAEDDASFERLSEAA